MRDEGLFITSNQKVQDNSDKSAQYTT